MPGVFAILSSFPDPIMWHASTGDQTFTGHFGLMLVHGILRMIDEMHELYDIDEEYELGLRAFDAQTHEQKAWSLRKAAFGLLDEATPMPELTAYMEATAAAIFYQLDACIQIEQDDGGFFWRNLVLAAYESVGGNSPEDLEGDEELLTAEFWIYRHSGIDFHAVNKFPFFGQSSTKFY